MSTARRVAILLGEPEADLLTAALAAADMPVIAAPNWLEAMIVIAVRLGPVGVQALVDLLDAAGVQVEPADANEFDRQGTPDGPTSGAGRARRDRSFSPTSWPPARRFGA